MALVQIYPFADWVETRPRGGVHVHPFASIAEPIADTWEPHQKDLFDHAVADEELDDHVGDDATWVRVAGIDGTHELRINSSRTYRIGGGYNLVAYYLNQAPPSDQYDAYWIFRMGDLPGDDTDGGFLCYDPSGAIGNRYRITCATAFGAWRFWLGNGYMGQYIKPWVKGEVITVRAEVRGSGSIPIYFNDTLAFTITDTSLSRTGRIGLESTGYNGGGYDGFGVMTERVELWAEPGGPPPEPPAGVGIHLGSRRSAGGGLGITLGRGFG